MPLHDHGDGGFDGNAGGDGGSRSHTPPTPPAKTSPPSRIRANASLRPVSIPEVVRDMAGPNPLRAMADFDRHLTGDYYLHLFHYFGFYSLFVCPGWLNSVGSRILYELDHRKPVLYVIPIQNIIGKLCLVPVGDTGTIPHRLRTAFPGAPGDRRPGSGDGCQVWFVNSWAMGWSRDM